MSKLIQPKTLLSSIPDLYETEEIHDPICHIKLFIPDGNWSWYIMEISKENRNICFGYVEGLENELGYFALSEIEEIHGPLGLKVERDLYFKPTILSKIRSNA